MIQTRAPGRGGTKEDKQPRELAASDRTRTRFRSNMSSPFCTANVALPTPTCPSDLLGVRIKSTAILRYPRFQTRRQLILRCWPVPMKLRAGSYHNTGNTAVFMLMGEGLFACRPPSRAHHRDDAKDDLEGGLVEEAVERVQADQLLHVSLRLEAPDVPPPCTPCRVGMRSTRETQDHHGGEAEANRRTHSKLNAGTPTMPSSLHGNTHAHMLHVSSRRGWKAMRGLDMNMIRRCLPELPFSNAPRYPPARAQFAEP